MLDPRSHGKAATQAGVFVLLYLILIFLILPLITWAGGYFMGLTVGQLLSTAFATALTMRIFMDRALPDVGLHWNGISARNAAWGFLGGAGAALLVIGVPLAFHLAHFEPSSGANWRSALFFPVLILCGAAGEELLFHGFAFQVLFRTVGAWATILPVGLLFGFLHNDNPHHTNVSLVNTAAFGILFGLAFFRSRDLWLPTGLHFGWNLALPLLGADLSGLTMKPTGITLVWNVGTLWSGGDYGPEASLFTSSVLFLLLVYVLKIPVGRQDAPLLDGALSSSSQPFRPLPETSLLPRTGSNSSADSPPSTPP